MKKGSVLVTGGAGYIGSHVVRDLCDAGYEVIVLDDLSTGRRQNLLGGTFYEGNVGNDNLVSQLIDRHSITSLIHFAAHIQVEESVSHPDKYYLNNSFSALKLFVTAIKHGISSIVFSSTAAVYGIPKQVPVSESSVLKPINPYGNSKMITELMLTDLAAANPQIQFVALRYFNVAGADRAGRIGQCYPKPTHLITLALRVALGQKTELQIFGNDYDTTDGTCIRDYIHVDDLASAHLLALRALERRLGSKIYNCGYGKGHSVLQVIEAINRVTGQIIPTRMCGRRAGDPPSLVADSSLIQRELAWVPQCADLDEIIRSSWIWEVKRAQMDV